MELVDRDKLLARLKDSKAYGMSMFKFSNVLNPVEVVADAMIDDAKDAPTVDAVPVVRCKDCKHWSDADDYKSGARECGHAEGWLLTMPDGFCCYGERKE